LVKSNFLFCHSTDSWLKKCEWSPKREIHFNESPIHIDSEPFGGSCPPRFHTL
jgi:hypothetical protein